jgi:hypothetical protein
MSLNSPVDTLPLPVVDGGTGAATLTSGGVLIGAGTSPVSATLTPSGLTSLSAGTLAATTTITAGTNITSTAGNITASAGALVCSTAGTGVVLGGGAQVVCGSGDPNGSVPAPKGSLYLRLDGSSVSTRAYINNSAGTGTVWVAVTTAS